MRSDDQFNELLARFLSGTYTPTLTGMAIGTGGGATNTATWSAVNCGSVWKMHIEGQILFGTSAPTFPTNGAVGLPSGWTIAMDVTSRPLGDVVMDDTGTRGYNGSLWRSTSTSLIVVVHGATGAYDSTISYTSTTAPFTWVAGDKIMWTADLHVTKT